MRKDSVEAHTNVHEFVNRIAEEVRKGYGIIPLTGAGISVAAGIPSGPVLQRYLTTLLENISTEEKKQKKRNPFENAGFNCLNEPWPPIDRDKLAKRKVKWPVDYMLLLTELASRMRLPTQQVFDSFFTFIMRDKEPSQAHRLLAHLTMHLGSQLVLTTNFDRLQERAFKDAGSKAEVYEIPSGGALPAYASVSDQPSIVKLHGGTTSLVAGNDVHDPPTISDIEAFQSYFTNGGTRVKNHLLVVGFAGFDTRILKMIQSLLRLNGELKVFWLAYNEDDCSAADDIHRSISDRERIPFDARSKWFFRCQHYDAGLFLLHLYQGVSFSIPSTSLLLPSPTSLPLAPYPAFSILNDARRDVEKSFQSKVEEFIGKISDDENRTDGIFSLTSHKGVYGALSVAAGVFHNLYYKRRVCLWFDIDENYDYYELLFSVYAATVKRLALTCELTSDVDSRNKSEIERTLRDILSKHPEQRVAVFLNLRGALLNKYADAASREWNKRFDDDDNEIAFKRFGNSTSSFFRSLGNKHALVFLLPDSKSLRGATRLLVDKDLSPYEERDAPLDEPKATFCYGLSLLRGSVHYSALISRSFFSDRTLKDRDRARYARVFVEELSASNRLRVKRGGFILVQGALREKILKHWESESEALVSPVKAVRLRRSLADWYEKVFFSSGDCLAALESVRFRLDQLILLPQYKDELEQRDEITTYAYPFAAFTQSLSLIRDAYPALVNYQHRHTVYKQVNELLEKALHLREVLRQHFTELREKTRAKSQIVDNFANSRRLIQELATLRQALRRKCDVHDSDVADPPRGKSEHDSTEPENNAEYFKACNCLRNHHFTLATAKLKIVLKSLEPVSPSGGKEYPYPLDAVFTGGHWLPKIETNTVMPHLNQAQLRLALKCLRRYSQVVIEELEALQAIGWCERLSANKEVSTLSDSILTRIEKRIQSAAHVYNVAREMRRYIVTRAHSGFLLRESSRIRLIQAQVLSIGGRRYESQRRLAESVATLRYAGRFYDSGWWAEYELGKCTVMLNLAEFDIQNVANSHTKAPSLEEKIEQRQAYNLIERYIKNAVDGYINGSKYAEQGRTSNTWLFRVVELRLRIASIVNRFENLGKLLEIEDYEILAARVLRVVDKRGGKGRLSSTWNSGMMLSGDDAYRRARLVVLSRCFPSNMEVVPINFSGKADPLVSELLKNL